MDDLLREFLTESGEGLSELNVKLVQLEQNPNDEALLNDIFRLVHTLKGTCGFLRLPRLESVAHASETVLGKIRGGELKVTPTAIALIFESIDTIKDLLGALQETDLEPEGNDQDLINRLKAAAKGRSGPESAAEAESPLAAHEGESESAPQPSPTPDTESAGGALACGATAKVASVPKESVIANQTIRVNVNLLENLMNLVGELVLTRNALLQMVRGPTDSDMNLRLQRLSQTTTELQEGVMKTRMQPIGNVWNQLPRMIRDLALDLGKKINLQMLGADTELDRQILELIKDPLVHMIRNSADHGIETTEDRIAAGKAAEGTLTLNAYHEGGHIIIEVSDDGRGIAIEKVKAKALANGMATEAELEAMNDQQIQQFILKPGFSTAETVTSVSGRGVGMDVVRTNIEKIGGTIELKSVEGNGSSFIIKIPLTLAIVSALIVGCAGVRFAVPQVSVVELVRASENSKHRIEKFNGASVLRLRESLLPLVSLSGLLKLEPLSAASDRVTEYENGVDPANGIQSEEGDGENLILVMTVGAKSFGILIDKVYGTEEIVVKPVAPILRGIGLYSGNTILGDGSVVMILDTNAIAAHSGEIAVTESDAGERMSFGARGAEDKVALLLFRAHTEEPKTIPLSLIARLEEIDVEAIEYSNGTPVVQYRGQLMPLATLVSDARIKSQGRQPVVVFSDADRSVGLAVDTIEDIVEEKFSVELSGEKPGIIGSAIVNGKATEVIDADYYLNVACSEWFGDKDQESYGAERQSRRLLLVDDSAFFRNLLTPLLSLAGYEVTTVDSAEKALSLRDRGSDFDVIVSDMEMPGKDGCSFAQSVKSDGPWTAKPLVALSTHATPTVLDRGRAVGFDDYVAKFDRDAILSSLNETQSTMRGAA